MRTLNFHRRVFGIATMAAASAMILTMPFISSAGRLMMPTSVNIVNNSNRTISHVYLSTVNSDDWSADQLSYAIGPGQSVTLGDVPCSQGQAKVIGEDQDGCFVTTVITCDQTSTWTITDVTARDCGN